MRHLNPLLLATACFIVFVSAPKSTSAQEKESYPVVNRIILDFSGFRSVSDQYVLSNVQLRRGMNYNPVLVDQSIRTLYGTGQFEFVEVGLIDALDDTVNVIFKLVSKYTIERVNFNGNEAYSDLRLVSKCGFESGESLDEYQVSVGKDEIQAYYIEKGYADAEVDYRIQRDKETGYAIINFDIDEAAKTRIEKINFVGNESIKDKILLSQMETAEHGWLSFITGSGRYADKEFKEDLKTLRSFYRDSGYLDCEINEDEISIEFFESNNISITIPVVEGELYYLGEFSIDGATVYTNDELLRSIRLVQEISSLRKKWTTQRRQSVTTILLMAILKVASVPNVFPT